MQKKLQDSNSKLALHSMVKLIWEKGPISRAELGRMSGYSRSTITVNCDRLLEAGILTEEPNIQNGTVKKRSKLLISSKQGVVLGIELGANSCEIGACNIFGELLYAESIAIDYTFDPDVIFQSITDTCDRILKTDQISSRKLLGIGVGLPSPVDYEKGCAVHPAFMPGWHLYPIGKLLETRYSCPVFVDNECNTMALGESSLSSDYRGKSMLFVKAGTGIGAGIIIDGEIYRGNSGLGGNIGHIQIDDEKIQCKCGKIGCLEAVAGGPAIEKKAMKIAAASEDTILHTLYKQKKTLTAIDVKYAATQGDKTALQIIKEAGEILGNVVGKLAVFFDPKGIVIGGGLSGFGPQYISYIRQNIMRQCTPWIKVDFEVKSSSYGKDIGMIGSAMLCIQELLSDGYLMLKFIDK